MTNKGELWGDARVGFPDWSGTAQLDQRRTGERARLEDVIGLDHEEWMILGIELGGGEVEHGRHDLHVVAVRRSDLPATKVDFDYNEEIPVTDFLVHNVDPYGILRAITHSFELRFRHRGWGEHPLRVVSLSDVPKQDD
ncbi:hypothetical protein [Rathayibacter sp. AY1A3]|uniref:hypothetical protein n=1 Tax=Rathayibacter sp. AY1A3 TaxID=2080521 RepID=UPI000CE7FC7D|nr:hypothetical protein [Rathayibacter sp. AY1A3]PPF36351.1 hypothetical protein C5C10_07030 [Rathayibacter sp. AY1A3]